VQNEKTETECIEYHRIRILSFRDRAFTAKQLSAIQYTMAVASRGDIDL